MRIWLVFVAVGMLVLLGCGSGEDSEVAQPITIDKTVGDLVPKPIPKAEDATCRILIPKARNETWSNTQILKVYDEVEEISRTDEKIECRLTVRSSKEGLATLYGSMEWDHEGDMFTNFGFFSSL